MGRQGTSRESAHSKLTELKRYQHRQNNSLRKGCIFDKAYDNILLDTGAEVSLIQASMLPESYPTQGTIRFQTPLGRAVNRPGVMVDVKVGTREFKLKCTVVEDWILSVPLLIGKDFSLLQLLAETTQTKQDLDMDELVRRKKKLAEEELTAEQEPTQKANSDTTGETEPEQQEEELPAEEQRLHLVNIITRAGAQ